MIIEWLRFKVPPEKWEAFILRDEEVWTGGIKKVPGFLGKEIGVDSVEPTFRRCVRAIKYF